MKRTGLHTILISLVLAMAMAAVVYFQLNMMESVNRASEKTVISLLSDNANQVKHVLDGQIDSVWSYMNIVDSAFQTIREMSREDAVAFLSNILPRTYNVELATQDGEYLNQFGKTGYVIPDEAAFRLFLDLERVCVLRQEATEDTIMFGIPITPVLVDGKEYSFILAYFQLEKLMSSLSVESFAGEGQIRVLNKDGFVILSSDNLDNDKTSYYFFKLYEDAQFIDNDIYADFEGFRESVMNGENYAAHVILDQEHNHVISYAKTDNLDWYVTIVVDYEDVLGELEKSVQSIGSNSLTFTVAVVIIALLLVSIIASDVYRVRQEKQQLQDLNTSLDAAKQVAEQALEIAENANRSKSFFLSNMSHDIRTPMNAITGFTTLLKKNARNPEKVLEYTEKISSSSRHLLGLINDVLDMSKIESGTITLNLSEETIGDIVSDLDSIIRPQMNAKGHTFHISIQNIVHERILVDKTRLNQILMNLLSNAAKYTPDGGRVDLTISEKNYSSSTAWYEITVADNGYGMSPEYVETIFDSFSREEDSRTSRIQGTGLGMAITKQLVDIMGGSISVESEKGKGSVFSVTLQFQLGTSDITPHFWEEYGISHCLVIDDEEVICQNIAISMENTGVTVDYALNGTAAIRWVRNSDPYQLVILDWKMPLMNGEETARQIRSLLPDQALILLLTGFDFSSSEQKKLEDVVDGILTKPFFVNTLKQKLIEIRQLRDEQTHGKKEEVSAASDSEAPSIFSGKHIMIAEDNDLNAEILYDLLTSCGADCVVYENGKLAWMAFEASAPGSFDLIFMDVQMPVMNGHEATRAIRSGKHPEAKKIPIIAMTADAFAEDIKAALASGMNAHIAKPVSIDTMESTVRQVLQAK